MSFDPLSAQYNPQDPYRQYHGQPEAEQKRMEHFAQAKLTGAIAGANRTLGADVTREPNICVNLDRMDKILSHQEELLTLLEQRIMPIVRAFPKQTREEGARTAAMQSALAERLYVYTQRADFLCARMNALIESIDL